MNIAVFASGKGTNLSAIIRQVKKGSLKVNIALMVTDNPKAPAISRARRAGVKVVIITPKDFPDKKSFEAEVIDQLKQNNVDLVVLAGFMLILGPNLISAYKDKIINIHPALLPSFKGASAIKDALDYGVKLTGVTVHFVDEKIDNGPIIMQEPVKIEEKDSLEILEKKIHRLEHKIYPKAIGLLAENRFKIENRKVVIL
ncbi:MAG: phosphoribosylglycinamide formyltransferase [Candidatus Omnitrophica bacterium CG11_big_fil_rev_8_21_14_0_20_42_13]|uniref:Phosphoribosylglycinamide formyltransferase n=1 Tax=Candidatus Ghiorseimicrobium undicola TaxID=1974746 RepID=A0A2H0LZX3_9BACT|nr:MAG: phosphoribosylglycinamide formyltransferase [Candidatus Omnitrophica bacterium CG11_big_fil_rev_8_21_14_0_20_42_13]